MAILQARRWLSVVKAAALYQPKDPDLDAVAASGVAAAWSAYTPTVFVGSGAITTLGAVSGRYVIMGKLAFVQMVINITTNGTAGTWVGGSLPIAHLASPVWAGRENAVTGVMLQGILVSGSVLLFKYDGTYPGGSGYQLMTSGSYEAA
jgi:hypothetical protein